MMNNYEDWAQLVAKKLKGEGELIAAIEKDDLDDAAATDSFCRAVLEPFLPENFGVGSGRIVDAFGNHSEHLDLIVYNRDFPRIGLRATQSAYLYESVLAAFSIRAKFIRKTFFESMDACASLANLEANVDKAVLVRLAKKNGLSLGPNKKFVHRDPLHTARFDLIGRPPAFVFGFSGMKQSYRQLHENIELWIKDRHERGHDVEMKSLPAVIATQGCFAWRNAAPLALSNREMLGIGNDEAPVRLIVLQMLYLLNRRLNVTSDGYGLKPNLKSYLSQFKPPVFEIGAGNIADVVNLNNANAGKPESEAEEPFREQTRSSFYEPARDHAPADEPAPTEVISDPEPASAPEPAASAPKPAQSAAPAPAPQPKATAKPAAQPQQPASRPQSAPAAPAADHGAAVFDKPSPFASAPIPPTEPAAEKPAPASKPATPDSGGAVFDKPSPFASAPKPPAESAPETPEPRRAPMASSLGSAPIPMDTPSQAANPAPAEPVSATPSPAADGSTAPGAPPTTPLGSAPIPPMQSNKSAEVIPPKPPVDIEFGVSDATVETDSVDEDGPEEDEFTQTVVIPPPNAAGEKKTEPRANSTDEFISRVKRQLANSGSRSTDTESESESDSFTSTIPQ